MAFTHLQPAEPTTLGYRFAVYAQDLFEDWQQLTAIRTGIRGKGFKGAVGTAAAYYDLLGAHNFTDFESGLSRALDLPFYPITTQTYPRKQDYLVLSALAGVGASLYKFAFDLRFLQSPPVGEISEPFGRQQVGSSAMPFKRNPINAEKIDSLARQLSVYPQIAWQNAANSLLERTLDDSANRRTILPEAFLICDELLRVSQNILEKIEIRKAAIARNLATYAPFAATERIMLLAAKRGADRQAIHEEIRQQALTAWQTLQSEGTNSLMEQLTHDPTLLKWVSAAEMEQLAGENEYGGIAPARALAIAAQIREI